MNDIEARLADLQSRMTQLETSLETLQADMEKIRRSTAKKAEYLADALNFTIFCVRAESRLVDTFIFLWTRPTYPHDLAVKFINACLTDMKHLLWILDELERHFKEEIGNREAKEMRLGFERPFLATCNRVLQRLMMLSKDSVSFDEFLSLTVDGVGMKNVKKVMTPNDVLRAYGIENNIRYKDFLSKQALTATFKRSPSWTL